MRRLVHLILFAWLLHPALARHEHYELERLIPGLSIRTTFAHDYGERLDSIGFQGQFFAPGEATHAILPRVDWLQRSDKLELGVAWAKVFGFHGCELLEKDDPRLGTALAPHAEFLDNGTFRYQAWAVVMTGREPGRRRILRRVEITPDALLNVTDLTPRGTGEVDGILPRKQP